MADDAGRDPYPIHPLDGEDPPLTSLMTAADRDPLIGPEKLREALR